MQHWMDAVFPGLPAWAFWLAVAACMGLMVLMNLGADAVLPDPPEHTPLAAPLRLL